MYLSDDTIEIIEEKLLHTGKNNYNFLIKDKVLLFLLRFINKMELTMIIKILKLDKKFWYMPKIYIFMPVINLQEDFTWNKI